VLGVTVVDVQHPTSPAAGHALTTVPPRDPVQVDVAED
jgi:hypothetical protein